MQRETPTVPSTTDSIAGVETFVLKPPGLGTALRVSIARPAAPALGAAAAPFEVVYVTDADYCFGTVVDAARVGGVAGEVAPAYVVGIGYAQETGDLRFTTKRRFLDFYRGEHRSVDMGVYGVLEFGGADAFVAALRDCVIPQAERRIGLADPRRRVLLGTSAGGHFAVHVLLEQPALFRGVALMSPILTDFPPTSGYDSLVRGIEGLSDGALPAGLRVFLSAGEREEDPGELLAPFCIVSNALRMRAALARLGVATAFVQFAGENHVSVCGAAISRALRFLIPTSAPAST